MSTKSAQVASAAIASAAAVFRERLLDCDKASPIMRAVWLRFGYGVLAEVFA